MLLNTFLCVRLCAFCLCVLHTDASVQSASLKPPAGFLLTSLRAFLGASIGFSLITSNTFGTACKPLQRGSSFQVSLCFIAMASSPVGSFVARSHCPGEINWLEWKKEILCPFVVGVTYKLRKTSCYFSSSMYLLLSKDC